MTVYVDTVRIRASVPNGPGRTVTGNWTHLMADSVAELDAFATTALGLHRAWRQDKASGVHYDLVENKRRSAVATGAVEIESGSPRWREVVAQAREQYRQLQYRVDTTW